jgi:hypothetical protein
VVLIWIAREKCRKREKYRNNRYSYFHVFTRILLLALGTGDFLGSEIKEGGEL